ncbi:MAG: hypothetical protein ACO3EY_03755 [Candidatus Nanopelagicales bacterium]
MEDRALKKIISIIRNNLNEEGAMALPTNNVGSGNIAGTPEADPGNPPVRKRKKYIYQKNSRKLWRQG